MKKLLLAADLHMSPKPAEQYRWGIWGEFRKIIKKYDVTDLVIAGDITDDKDRHESWLVNRVVDELQRLGRTVRVWIIMGNHDYHDPSNPFFKFLDAIEGVTFVAQPMAAHVGGVDALLLPHTENPDKWRELPGLIEDKYCLVVTHQCFRGVETVHGQTLDGTPPEVLKGLKAKIFSGDIHNHQKVGPVEYIGAPYHTRFDDRYEGRVIVYDFDSKRRNIKLSGKFPYKLTLDISSPDEIDHPGKTAIRAGDQLKVRLHLSQEDLHNWDRYKKQIREICKDQLIDLRGVVLEKQDSGSKRKRLTQHTRTKREKPSKTLDRYVKRQKVDEFTAEFGRAYVQADH